MNKKILIGSIIAVVILTIPVSTAIDIETVVDTKSSENFEIETLDNNREIISYIYGACYGIEFKDKGLIRRVEIWAGDPTWIDIIGSKLPTFPPLEFGFQVTAHHVIVPRFIGYSMYTHPTFRVVHGIALGNIEWE